MSVATKNPFALLDEDSSRPSSPPPKKSEPPAPAPQASRNANKNNRGGPASRGGKYYSRGGAKPTATTGDGNLNQEGIQDAPSSERKFDGRGRGRGGRGGGGGGGRGGRRPFDRHSQTGKTDSDKKIHQGWGGDQGETELKQEEAAATDAAAEGWGATTADESGWGAPAGEESATPADKPQGDKPARREREPEEEDNTLTLEQYIAQQKDKEPAGIETLNLRKVDAGDWSGATLLNKDEEESAYYAGKPKPSLKPRAKKEEKVTIDIDAHFERPQRGGRGRGRGEGRGDGRGRGEGRGRGRGRGGGRGDSSQATFNVDDEAAFPSLA